MNGAGAHGPSKLVQERPALIAQPGTYSRRRWPTKTGPGQVYAQTYDDPAARLLSKEWDHVLRRLSPRVGPSSAMLGAELAPARARQPRP